MKLPVHRKLTWILLVTFSTALFCIAEVSQFAQTNPQTPQRTGHVSDFAGVLDEKTRGQLSTILENVKQKMGIEFAIVTVESTSGQDIFDFSRNLAQEWNVGARTSRMKSLLLVLSAQDKTWLTQVSKSVQTDLPEGVLGEMTHQMQAPVQSGDFNNALTSGIRHFVKSMAEKLALNAEDFETVQATIADPAPVAKPAEEVVDRTPRPEGTEGVQLTAKPAATREAAVSTRSARVVMTGDDAAEAEEVEVTLTLPPEARVAKLKSFLQEHPNSKSKMRATELLVSAHAAFGDERLKKGDSERGIEQMMLAISEAPANGSEKLFTGVLAQIPLNLYLRGEAAAATRAARDIEAKFGTDAKRLLAIAGFYLGTEQGGEAVRTATRAVTLAPDLAEAHQALALAYHISLRLDEAVGEYKRALELDPNSKAAQRALADLVRGSGKADEALALYRQQLVADPKDKAARAGLVLSLLDLGRADEAKIELDAELAADSKNLGLLAGAAYWFAAHNDNEKAFQLGTKALELEPRYTWLQIAMARSLIAQKKPLEAERAIRFAQLYGKFPTLDYELATALASAGLYDEAAEILRRSFTIKDGFIHTRLAGHAPAQGTNFIELLAPERRASIFQSAPADTETNARSMKDLLTFADLIAQDPSGGAVNEARAVAAALQFASGEDAARVHRQLYAASRLLQRGIGFQTAFELAEAARSSADAGMTVPALTVAVQADEYREIRARAIAAGGTPDIPEAPRNVLSNLLRGRIEDIAGWARFNQDKLDEALDHLKRAVTVLPEGTPSWRTSLWHLGAVLERLDRKDDALANYIKSYNTGEPDPVRRTVIERLYQKINGSLTGLEERISGTGTAKLETPAPEPTTAPSQPTPSPDSAPAVSSPITPDAEASPTPAPVISPEVPPSAEVAATPTPEATPVPSPDATPASTPSPAPDAPTVTSPSLAASPVETIIKPRPTVVTITGRVRDAQNNPLANVVVVLIGPQGSVLASTTDAGGNYSFSVAPSASSYRLIPSKDGFGFEPLDNLLPNVSEDRKVDFLATPTRSP
ncbi:MAG: TPM domain-containing protein [Acidobacteriota bacterium]|nr:TPM domain-containing protein [Acidobacteriota bacterium]